MPPVSFFLVIQAKCSSLTDQSQALLGPNQPVCNELPLRGEKPDFGALSNYNTAFGAMRRR